MILCFYSFPKLISKFENFLNHTLPCLAILACCLQNSLNLFQFSPLPCLFICIRDKTVSTFLLPSSSSGANLNVFNNVLDITGIVCLCLYSQIQILVLLNSAKMEGIFLSLGNLSFSWENNIYRIICTAWYTTIFVWWHN